MCLIVVQRRFIASIVYPSNLYSSSRGTLLVIHILFVVNSSYPNFTWTL